MATVNLDETSAEPTGVGRGAKDPHHAAGPVGTLSGEFSAVAAEAPATLAPRRRRALPAKSRYMNRVNGRVKFPERREAGNRPYLVQLVKTCLPLALGDVAGLTLAVLIASLVGFNWHLGADEPLRVMLRWFVPTIVGLLTINAAVGLYPAVRLGLVEEARRISLSLAVLLVMTFSRMSLGSELLRHRLLFAVAVFFISLFCLPYVRSKLRRVLGRTNWWGFSTLVCGHDAAVVSVYQWLADNRRLGLRPLGVVASPAALEFDKETPGYLGDWSDANRLANRGEAYWAVMVEPPETKDDITSTIEQYLGSVPHVFVVSQLTGMPDHWNRHQMSEGLEGLLVEHHLMLPVQQIVKRLMDLAIVATVGLLLSPLFLALAVVIKLSSKGPIFYGHERVGRGNTRFRAWKFRTMIANAENLIEDYLNQNPELRDEWERTHKLKQDPRVTAVGRFMRKWSIDELPQLWNVLVGEMSAVGPRPIVPNEIVKYGEHFESFCSVLPGMTGLWQVCGRNDTTFDERIRLGMYYIHHWSPSLDAYLLVRTAKTVLFSKGAY
ncbi:MAG TPA: undecaprenyl-phosphate galactose phosphotransferase WbaP [Lacipirellulaceae bacterium]|nr:undecaprenyl-phosphate galactose phosphotransferase WbaP [Lacipirellulaceae bacterium]